MKHSLLWVALFTLPLALACSESTDEGERSTQGTLAMKPGTQAHSPISRFKLAVDANEHEVDLDCMRGFLNGATQEDFPARAASARQGCTGRNRSAHGAVRLHHYNNYNNWWDDYRWRPWWNQWYGDYYGNNNLSCGFWNRSWSNWNIDCTYYTFGYDWRSNNYNWYNNNQWYSSGYCASYCTYSWSSACVSYCGG